MGKSVCKRTDSKVCQTWQLQYNNTFMHFIYTVHAKKRVKKIKNKHHGFKQHAIKGTIPRYPEYTHYLCS